MTWMDCARRGLVVGWCLLALLAATIRAESTFYLTETETQFSLTLANDSSDVFLFFTSPAYSWVGVGFGESMKNSLSFIMYPNKADTNVTVSPRIATGNSEPTLAPEIELDVLDGTGIADDMFVLKAVCHNCRSWRGGQIDTTSLAHPMIYAFGPATGIQSNDPNAGLKRHTRYGTFDMNMVAATGKGEVPAPNAALNGVTLRTGPVKDHHRKDLAHSVLGCIAIFVIWPLNVVAAGFLRNIRIHIGLSVFLLIFLTISYALGISISNEFNRSKSYTSPHQLLALVTLLPILFLSLLPTKPLSSLTPHIPRLHAPLTTLTFSLLAIAGGLGLSLGGQPTTLSLSYAAVAVAVFVFMTLLQLCIKRRGSAYARATTRRRLGEEDEHDFGMAKWGVRREMGQEGVQMQAQGQWVQDGAQPQGQHARTPSGGSPYGGGTMPGPQYLLNMHPGVPVHKW